jgi:hypothetical protein
VEQALRVRTDSASMVMDGLFLIAAKIGIFCDMGKVGEHLNK